MIPLNWFNIILIAGFVQGVVLFIAIVRLKKANGRANRYIASLVAVISVALIGRLAYSQAVLEEHMQFAMLPDFILFLFGPILYLYVGALLDFPSRGTRNSWKHFIPAVLHLIVMAGMFAINSKEYMQMAADGALIVPMYAILSTALVHNIIYLAGCCSIVMSFQRNTHESLSFTPQIKYLYTILSLVGLCLFIWLASTVIALTGSSRPDFATYSLIWVVLTFLVYVLGYYAMNQPDLFVSARLREKYQGSRLDSTQIGELVSKLDTMMREKQLYKQPRLSNQELAMHMELNTTDLSRIINEGLGRNFFDFVNAYRINEFVQLVQSEVHQHLTLVAIAKEAGFNSKTTFNAAFKKQTGLTPSAFLKSNSKSSAIQAGATSSY
ncbi:MAG: helix-turn-helix domain-containing protein [Bacteroidetes bacterium]|nr:helix-turn-helix domain-containing protein [Bacteroidota bacterium]